MSRIYIKTLGGFQIERDGNIIQNLPNQPVRCALFLYLAIKRKATRDELTTIIWPDRNDEKTRHSLSQTLYELRKQLGESFFHSTNEYLQVTDEVTVDSLEFLKSAESGHDQKAFDLYNGLFLQGYHFVGSDDFINWIERQRFELERRFRDVCRSLSNKHLEAGDDKAALEISRKWVETDPLEDEAQHLLIGLLAKTGHRAEAIQQYNSYEELISKELDIEPLDETKSLIRKIRPEKSDSPLPEKSNFLIRTSAACLQDRFAEGESETADKSQKNRYNSWMILALLLSASIIYLVFTYSRFDDHLISEQIETFFNADGIAVLPFVNMSPDPEQEYFADGITEDLLTSLTKLQSMRVISRTSVMRYKNSDLSLPEIAGELNVAYILEGSVRREQNQVRITAQLINVEQDNHLWAETYDRELTDIFQVKSEISYQIAEALQQYLPVADHDRIARGGTENITAYDLLLRGREYLNRPGVADQRKYTVAADFFRQAIEADPDFTRAYASLSEVFRRNVLLPITARRDSMLYYSAKAIELDSNLPEAATEMGYAYLFDWKHSLAEIEFQRALALDPNQAEAMSGLARLSAINGRLDEAVRWERLGLRSDPLSTERLFNLGQYLFDLGDIDGAQNSFQKIVSLVPDHPEASYLLALTHLILNEEELAASRMQTLMETASDPTTSNVMMARYLAQIGNYEEAEQYLLQSPAAGFGATRVFHAFIAGKLGKPDLAADLVNQPARSFSEWDSIGFSTPPRGKFYVSLIQGDLHQAISIFRQYWNSGLYWLEDPPDLGIYWIDRHPITEPLHDDLHFNELLSEMRAAFDLKRANIQQEFLQF